MYEILIDQNKINIKFWEQNRIKPKQTNIDLGGSYKGKLLANK